MTKFYVLCLFLLALTVLFFLNTAQTYAANCVPLYNGGITSQQYCFNPTPAPQSGTGSLPATQITPLQQQTRGGQRVYPAAQSKTTPDTGPEAWSLPALFVIGITGFLLRKKTQISFKNN